MYSTKSHCFDKSMSNEIDHLPCLLTLADFGWIQFSSKNFLKYCKRDRALENDIIEIHIPAVKVKSFRFSVARRAVPQFFFPSATKKFD